MSDTDVTETKPDPINKKMAKELFRAMMLKSEPPLKPGTDEYKEEWKTQRKQMFSVTRMARRRMDKAGIEFLYTPPEEEEAS